MNPLFIKHIRKVINNYQFNCHRIDQYLFIFKGFDRFFDQCGLELEPLIDAAAPLLKEYERIELHEQKNYAVLLDHALGFTQKQWTAISAAHRLVLVDLAAVSGYQPLALTYLNEQKQPADQIIASRFEHLIVYNHAPWGIYRPLPETLKTERLSALYPTSLIMQKFYADHPENTKPSPVYQLAQSQAVLDYIFAG